MIFLFTLIYVIFLITKSKYLRRKIDHYSLFNKIYNFNNFTLKWDLEHKNYLNNYQDSKRLLLIANHVCMTDFFFLIKYLESTFPDFTPIYIIADFVKSIPLVDEIMGKNTIFIQRKYSEDEKLLKNKLYEFSKKNEKYILIIFPEGKIFTGEAIKKSNEWTLKKNEKMFNRVLYPRYKGIKIVLDYFKPNNIINLDLVYPDDILNTKGKRHRDFLIDNLPHQCFIRGTDITDLFKLNEDLEKILLHIWRKKDEFLTNYYQNKYEKQIKN